MILPRFQTRDKLIHGFGILLLFAKIAISRRPRFSWGYSNAQTVQALCLAFSRRPQETGRY